MSFGPEFRLPQPFFDTDKPGGGGSGGQGRGGSGGETIKIDTKDNMGSATVIIEPGKDGGPGTVVEVQRPPKP